MGRRARLPLIALSCWLALVAASCRKLIGERQARVIADDAVAAYAKRRNLNPQDFEVKQFDDSGKVVDWFFEFRSTTDPHRIVAVIVDRHGGFEVHHSPGQETRDVR